MVRNIRVKSIDFVFAIHRLVGIHEFRKEVKKVGVEPSKEIEGLIEELSTSVSMRVFEDLKLLFRKYYLDGMIANIAINNPDKNPREIIQLVKAVGPDGFYDAYIKEYVRPRETGEQGIKARIDELIENNTSQIIMTYSQLKKFKNEAPEIYYKCIETLTQFVASYEKIETRVNAIYDREISNFEEAMKDETKFRNSYLMIQFEGETHSLSDIDVCMTVLGEYVLMYKISEDHMSMKMILGFAMRNITSEKEETIEQEVFKCLGDPTKLLMIQMASKEPVCAKDYADRLKLSKATISHHIGLLLGLRLLTLHIQNGKKMYYSTNIELLRRLFDNFIGDLEANN